MKKLLYIDLFCGAGGTSTGVNSAMVDNERCAEVIACVNHDPKAIASHASNHPKALHFIEDIRVLELSSIVNHVKKCRRGSPGSLVVLWASLECTNFSRAKGGQPRNQDSRTLAEHLFRYIDVIEPEYIYIENVEEFLNWGDLDNDGRPIPEEKGNRFKRWVHNVESYGYHFDYRILNAADFGAYTSRKRFFGIFAKGYYPIVFPSQMYSKDGKGECMKKWKPVRDVIDIKDSGNSIFRNKSLAEKTLERIYAGLIKFVAGGKESFLLKYNSMNKNGKYNAPGIDEPCPVVVTQNRLGIIQVSFMSKQYSGHPESKNTSVDEPAGTITTIDHHAFISAYYNKGGIYSIDTSSPTATGQDRLNIVNVTRLIDMQYRNGKPASVDTVAGTVTADPKRNLVTVVEVTLPEGTAGGQPRPLPHIMIDGSGRMFIKVYESDSPTMIKIKEFMAMYGIIDIGMRMLKVQELKKIMGFPEDYVLVGSQSDQKKFIGNAVEVNMSRVLCEALYKVINGK